MTKMIDVLGKPQAVNIQRTYKTVWIAVGEYMGKRIEVRERSENQALAAWLVEVANLPRC